MEIYTEDYKKYIDVGGEDLFFSLYSTIKIRINNAEIKMPLAMDFLKARKYEGKEGYEVARQFNLIRDELSNIRPSEIVYNCNDLNKKVPWGDNISPIITSAANYYITADGKDLLYEIVAILCYAEARKVAVYAK